MVSDEIGVAYPIIDGIPNLVPSDAKRLLTYQDEETYNRLESNKKQSIFSDDWKRNQQNIETIKGI